MAVHIIGTWELGWNTPIKEVDLWQYPLRDLGVDRFYMEPVSGIRNDEVTEVSDMSATIQEHRDQNFTVVFVDEKGTVELEDFVHPENALYVFGKATMSPFVAYKKDGDQSLYISTKLNGGLLWPHQAATLVLYDRMKKESNT